LRIPYPWLPDGIFRGSRGEGESMTFIGNIFLQQPERIMRLRFAFEQKNIIFVTTVTVTTVTKLKMYEILQQGK
jgi:hypothetical protein